ncbi:hypothetical protein CF327_g2042 [Tilletia walkeri]|nr:hypothetical protein CF327_g2042 [Tilletia walkeri]
MSYNQPPHAHSQSAPPQQSSSGDSSSSSADPRKDDTIKTGERSYTRHIGNTSPNGVLGGDVEGSKLIVLGKDHHYTFLGEDLGEGAYGTVALVCRSDDKKLYAIKSCRRVMSVEFCNEAELLKEAASDHVVKLIEYFKYDGMWRMVMEVAELGSLDGFLESSGQLSQPSDAVTKHLQENGLHAPFLHLQQQLHDLRPSARGCLHESLAAYILVQIAEAMVFLRSSGKKIIHRDLKPAIQAGARADMPWVQLADFGSATKSESVDFRRTFVGTEAYMAPEVHEQEYRPSSQMWSLGVIVFQMLWGRLPFEHSYGRNITGWEFPDESHKEGCLRMGVRLGEEEELHSVSQDFKSLLQAMLSFDPDKRIAAEDLQERAIKLLERLQQAGSIMAESAHRHDTSVQDNSGASNTGDTPTLRANVGLSGASGAPDALQQGHSTYSVTAGGTYRNSRPSPVTDEDSCAMVSSPRSDIPFPSQSCLRQSGIYGPSGSNTSVNTRLLRATRSSPDLAGGNNGLIPRTRCRAMGILRVQGSLHDLPRSHQTNPSSSLAVNCSGIYEDANSYTPASSSLSDLSLASGTYEDALEFHGFSQFELSPFTDFSKSTPALLPQKTSVEDAKPKPAPRRPDPVVHVFTKRIPFSTNQFPLKSWASQLQLIVVVQSQTQQQDFFSTLHPTLEADLLRELAILRRSISSGLASRAATQRSVTRYGGGGGRNDQQNAREGQDDEEEEEGIQSLLGDWRSLSHFSSRAFGWALDEELDEAAEVREDEEAEEGEDAPVVVDLDDDEYG